MKTIDDRLEHAAEEVRQRVAEVPTRGTGAAARHLRVVRVVQVGAVVALVLAMIGASLLLDPTASPRGFVAPAGEPDREADLFVWFHSDIDSVTAQLAAADVATWEGVEYASFWGADQTLQEFAELFPDQPSLIEIVEQDPSVLPASIRIWVGPNADTDELVELARQTFPDAVAVGTREQRSALETGIVTSGATTTIAVPTELEQAGTDLQNAILADGKVSRDEFVRAVARMAACMTDHGLTGVTWSVDDAGGGWSSGYNSPADDAAEQAIDHLCYYSYVDRVSLSTQWAPTELTAAVAAFLPVLEELDAQVVALLNRANQIEYNWENRQATFASTTNALTSLHADLETWAASVVGRTDVPSDLESAYAVLVDEASDLPGAAEAILLGVQAPDNGTQRRTAVTVFVQETLDVVYAIDTLRRGG